MVDGVLDLSKHSAMTFRGDVHQKLHNSAARRDTVSKDGFSSSANDKKIMGNFNISHGG